MNGSVPDPGGATAVNPIPAKVHGRLFHKYVVLFAAVVCATLLANGLIEIWFLYRDHTALLLRLQREQAEATAAKIGQFVKEIENQIGWTTHLPWSAGALEPRRTEALRLLLRVPAVTELALLDAAGRERVRVSRLAMDVIDSQIDLSHEPKFVEAMARKVYYGPVYFHRESEPYMTLALAGARRDAGVSVTEVNLKFIWDVVSRIKVGQRGQAYVVDGRGRLIAHPDISLVLRKTDLSGFSQVQTARAVTATSDRVVSAQDIHGRKVLAAYAPVAPLDWTVFVELPLDEAYAPLYASIKRTGILLLLGLAIAFLAGLLLARRMVVPIEALRAGAAEIGGGDLGRRIIVKTGDELEALADQFNDMTGRLQESYADLEKKVEARTRELRESLEWQTATAEVLRVIASSPGELDLVFQTMLEKATRLCEARFGTMFLYDGEVFNVCALSNAPAAFEAELRRLGPRSPAPGTALARLVATKQPVHIHDYAELSVQVAVIALSGARSYLAIPMLKGDVLVGAFVIYRQEVRPFTDRQIGVVTTFADQAVIAIENMRLLNELRTRTRELARSVDELKALDEVSRAVNSTLDLETVLTTIVTRAVELSGTDAGAIYVRDTADGDLRFRATYGMGEELVKALSDAGSAWQPTLIGRAAVESREAIQVAEITAHPDYPLREIILRAGFKAVLAVPLLRDNEAVGALVVRRKTTGTFERNTVELLQTMGTQSALAIYNARLFGEIEEKGRQLAVASQHKSQFLANMSHELRTPLNAILGYTELVLDNIYGDTPEKIRRVLDRVQSNGRHLLGLINDVLDLSKIEAGQLTLSLADYSLKETVQSALAAVEALAAEKGLSLKLDLAPDLPRGRGDERRIAQVLLNLLGNAIKFTDTGEVGVSASAANGTFTLAVRDTGPGIAEVDQRRIFEEFQQADNSETRKKGGTGLGLAIARRMVEMHGGRMWVESSPGRGSTFWFTLPVTVERKEEAA